MNSNCYADHKFTKITEEFRELKDYTDKRERALYVLLVFNK